MNYRAQRGSLHRSISSKSVRGKKSGYEIKKYMHKKHGIELNKSKMDPVLLVQTKVPGGLGQSQNKGKGKGRTNVDTWKGKCQLGFTQLVSKPSSTAIHV